METPAPSIVLFLDYDDANNVLSGVLNLKCFKVFKSKSPEDCLSQLNGVQGKVDAILIKKELAIKEDYSLVNKIKKINPNIMVIVLADNVNEYEPLLQHGVDQFFLTPLSPENLADKILVTLARNELKKLRERTLNR
jgi:response regulator RpfG family c-di-GMP phosphodiesterase